jgi:16S rRNA (uracil1498-N3)-methyltransferase
MRRIWADEPAEVLIIRGAEHNHIANVLRMSAGGEITVISGDKFNRLYVISDITKKQTALRFVSQTKNECNPDKEFTVYLALIKADNLAVAVQKLNEIGVTELKLFASKFTSVPVKQINIARLNEIARQSCKQCGRSIPLRVSFVRDLFADLAGKHALFADEMRRHKGNSGLIQYSGFDSLVVGGAGGFDSDEREKLNVLATPFSLGHRILRAETAAIVGAARCILI